MENQILLQFVDYNSKKATFTPLLLTKFLSRGDDKDKSYNIGFTVKKQYTK